MLEVHVGGLDRRVGAIGERAVDGIAAVEARAAAEPATVDLQIHAIALSPSEMEMRRDVRGIVAACDHPVRNDLGQRLQHRVEAAVGRQQAGAHGRGISRIDQRAFRRGDRGSAA